MSMETKSIKCYIEEYADTQGRLSARLREKHTGHKVDFGFSGTAEKHQLLAFLSAAKRNQADMPGVFSKDEEDDCVEVSGEVDFDSPDEIRFV